MQMVAGRTAQEYNQRKLRKGAFWEDRYHATAIEKDDHLVHCLVYIDLNMVRAGVVDHPSEWKESGYNEIQNPRQRYAIIDHDRLMQLFEQRTVEDLKASHQQWVEMGLKAKVKKRERKWAASIALVATILFQRPKGALVSAEWMRTRMILFCTKPRSRTL